MPDAIDPLLIEITSEVVAAYVVNNAVPRTELGDLIASVHRTFVDLGRTPPIAAEARPTPPVSVKKSVGDDFIVSMEDGKPYKALKRHLAKHGLTPETYRAKWGLPRDYPMVAPAYARSRSALAKEMGLGQLRRNR